MGCFVKIEHNPLNHHLRLFIKKSDPLCPHCEEELDSSSSTSSWEDVVSKLIGEGIILDILSPDIVSLNRNAVSQNFQVVSVTFGLSW